MKNQIRKCGYLTVAALLCFAAGAFAQNTSVVYTGSSGYSGAGGVIGPQTATVGGVDMTVISTDYADSTSANSGSWIAVAQSVGTGQANSLNVTADNTMFGSQLTTPFQMCSATSTIYQCVGASNAQQVYQLAAYLGSTMISTCGTTTACQTGYQDAIWFLFDPSNTALENTSCAASDPNCAYNILSNLSYSANVGSSTNFSNVLVLSPDIAAVDPPCVSGNTTALNCGDPEMLAYATPTVSTPESSAPVLFGADLLGLAGLAFLFRQRLIRVKG